MLGGSFLLNPDLQYFYEIVNEEGFYNLMYKKPLILDTAVGRVVGNFPMLLTNPPDELVFKPAPSYGDEFIAIEFEDKNELLKTFSVDFLTLSNLGNGLFTKYGGKVEFTLPRDIASIITDPDPDIDISEKYPEIAGKIKEFVDKYGDNSKFSLDLGKLLDEFDLAGNSLTGKTKVVTTTKFVEWKNYDNQVRNVRYRSEFLDKYSNSTIQSLYLILNSVDLLARKIEYGLKLMGYQSGEEMLNHSLSTYGYSNPLNLSANHVDPQKLKHIFTIVDSFYEKYKDPNDPYNTDALLEHIDELFDNIYNYTKDRKLTLYEYLFTKMVINDLIPSYGTWEQKRDNYREILETGDEKQIIEFIEEDPFTKRTFLKKFGKFNNTLILGGMHLYLSLVRDSLEKFVVDKDYRAGFDNLLKAFGVKLAYIFPDTQRLLDILSKNTFSDMIEFLFDLPITHKVYGKDFPRYEYKIGNRGLLDEDGVKEFFTNIVYVKQPAKEFINKLFHPDQFPNLDYLYYWFKDEQLGKEIGIEVNEHKTKISPFVSGNLNNIFVADQQGNKKELLKFDVLKTLFGVMPYNLLNGVMNLFDLYGLNRAELIFNRIVNSIKNNKKTNGYVLLKEDEFSGSLLLKTATKSEPIHVPPNKLINRNILNDTLTYPNIYNLLAGLYVQPKMTIYGMNSYQSVSSIAKDFERLLGNIRYTLEGHPALFFNSYPSILLFGEPKNIEDVYTLPINDRDLKSIDIFKEMSNNLGNYNINITKDYKNSC